jgi:hypothetical protein
LYLCLSKYYAMKTYPKLSEALRHGDVWWNGGIAPHIHNIGITWKWVVSFTPQLLYLWRKSPWYPLDRRLGGP